MMLKKLIKGIVTMRFKTFQALIDIIRFKKPINLKFLGDEQLIIKKIKYLKKQNQVKTLILGSSHIETSYIADEEEFNLGTSSQDLYTSYKLYEKFNTKHLENVVLSYSNFSPWSHLVRGLSSDYTIYFKLLADIDYEEKLYAKKYNLYLKEFLNVSYIYNQYKKMKVEDSYRGNFTNYPNDYKELTSEMKETILKAENRRRDCFEKYVLRLINDTAMRNQNLYFVITPQGKELREILAEKGEMFKELYEITEKYNHIHIIDLYDSPLFEKSDFYDWQHLNYNGALKLTKIVKEKIYGE